MTNADASLTINPVKLHEGDPAALHCHYPTQNDPQPCCLILDLEDGDLTATYNPNIDGGVTTREWNGIVRSWSIPCLTAASANRLIDDVAPIAQRILDGATVEWDGSNHVGRLNADASEAAEELATTLAALCECADS